MAVSMNCLLVNAKFNTACRERVSELRPDARCSDDLNPDPPCQKFALSTVVSSASVKLDPVFIETCAQAIVKWLDELSYTHFRVSSSIVTSSAAAPMQLVSMLVF